MQIRHIIPIVLFLIVPFISWSQEVKKDRRQIRKERINEMIRMEEEGVITFEKSFVFGAKLTNDGYGIFFELGRARSVKRGMLYQLEITERKHPKEAKLGSVIPYGVSLIYGKQNFFYPVKLGVQEQFLLGNKSNKNGVAVTANLGGGFTAGLLRPYYAQVFDDLGGLKYIKYDSPEKDEFLDTNVLVGGPAFNKGWDELTLVPGVYGKAALRFDYGRFNELITGLEVGITGEYYSQKIPQMVFAKENQFFFGAYCAILFGKRK